MNRIAVDAGYQCLSKAAASIEAMKTSTQVFDFEIAWSDFLSSAHRIFSKLEQGAKVSSSSKAWFAQKIHERRTDPLLAYIHHARNADEHGLQPSVRIQGARLGKPLFERVGTLGSFGSPTKTSLVELRPIEIEPTSAKLFPVLDRGVAYSPPTEHLGKPLQHPPFAVNTAETALLFLKELVAKASKLT